MTHTPDRIWATGNGSTGSWNSTQVNPRAAPHQTEYLLATPAREAADDMLAALEATSLVLAEHEPHPLPVLAQVLAAIAKAKGTH